MKKIPLNQGKFALVDDADFDHLYEYRWMSTARRDRGFYVIRQIMNGKRGGGGRVYMHREILKPQPGFDVDHIDGDGLNNQRSNLRICKHGDNLCNRQGPNTNSLSGVRGISWRGPNRGWRTRLMKDGREYTFGSYDTPEEALAAVMEGAKKLHLEFASGYIRNGVDLAMLPRRTNRPSA